MECEELRVEMMEEQADVVIEEENDEEKELSTQSQTTLIEKTEKTGLEMVRGLAPRVGKMMREMLNDGKTPAMVKVRLMEIVLEYAYGKPESTIKVMNAQQSVEASEVRIAAIVETVRKEFQSE